MFDLSDYPQLQGEVFERVQEACIFEDSKTFVDCIPKCSADEMVVLLRESDDLESFVKVNFDPPHIEELHVEADTPEEYIEKVWPLLRRELKSKGEGDSLISLPRPHIVPGGRFREGYYWDTYFTALGLTDRLEWIEDLIVNFAYLIDTYGHIPNGNRVYYLSRSQQPFFSHLLELFESLGGTIEPYLAQLEKEHAFFTQEGRVDGHGLSHYDDTRHLPREESYREDKDQPAGSFRHIRAACESGWDFSSRWQGRAADILPVDLNCLLYHMEIMLSRLDAKYESMAHRRASTINVHLWNESEGYFVDGNSSHALTAATLMPLFVGLADEKQAARVAEAVEKHLLAPGGMSTTTEKTGEQWDAPNGWAPLIWIAYSGLKRYGHIELAEEIGRRWLQNNDQLFNRVGKMVEKYVVDGSDQMASGGEYSLQEGFGWTNGVYLALKKELR